jgi:hypothetical protein
MKSWPCHDTIAGQSILLFINAYVTTSRVFKIMWQRLFHGQRDPLQYKPHQNHCSCLSRRIACMYSTRVAKYILQLPKTEALKLTLVLNETKLTTFPSASPSAVSVHEVYQFLLSFR